ncbi:Hsp20/alpha crystallin family protein [Candidatus Omnitrophota bacterium]
MSLIEWRKDNSNDPLFGLLAVQNDLDRLFGLSFFDNVDKRVGMFKNAFSPDLDVYEDKDNLIIKADLPGIRQEKVNVEVVDDILTIRGEKNQEVERKDKSCYRFERAYGSFSRSITLPKYVDASKAKASFKDGVLDLTIPKTEDAKNRKIKIDINR